MKIEIEKEVKIKFPFENFFNYMVSLLPYRDISGLEKIRIQNKINSKLEKVNHKTQAFYHQDKINNKGYIDIILKNIIDVSIPSYAFEIHTEIGALLISEILFHEIGHHVHYKKRHGVKRKEYEKFADKYAKAGYLTYLKSRSSKILSSYRWASLNLLVFNKEERSRFSKVRQELVNYLSNNRGEIIFP